MNKAQEKLRGTPVWAAAEEAGLKCAMALVQGGVLDRDDHVGQKVAYDAIGLIILDALREKSARDSAWFTKQVTFMHLMGAACTPIPCVCGCKGCLGDRERGNQTYKEWQEAYGEFIDASTQANEEGVTMAGTMSRSAWVKMLNEDVVWLYDVPGSDGPSTEKGHVLEILRSLRIVSPLAYNAFLASERKKRKEEASSDGEASGT